ncbi:MAG: sugar phosphate isomerase/epimerase family protein [Candidatus Thorarchaeota archaeon]
MNQISITTGPLNRLFNRPYFVFESTIEVMQSLSSNSIVDGFEVQNLAEWDVRWPPRDEYTKGHRRKRWETANKYTFEELSSMLIDSGLPILSIHANRDVGICLCSEDETEIENGRTMIHETLKLASNVGAGIAVFHLWDTWKEEFNVGSLIDELGQIASEYPNVRASVENVPTHFAGRTPFDLARCFEWITVDTHWAAMYMELEHFGDVRPRIINVHVRGSLSDSHWVLEGVPFASSDAFSIIIGEWQYDGILTLEPEPSTSEMTLDQLETAVLRLRRIQN